MKPKLIILDFDGVIIESVDLKTKAFEQMFKDDPAVSSAFMDFHRKNSGRSRFDKFEWLYKNILKKPLSEKEKQALGNKFSSLISKNIMKAPYVKGAVGFLKEFHKVLPLYLASITPKAELKKIIGKKGLAKYFTGVNGTIGKKSNLINRILKLEKAMPEETVFIGDTKEDHLASQETGVRFVARVKQEKFKGLNIKKVKDLDEFSLWIKEELEDYNNK